MIKVQPGHHAGLIKSSDELQCMREAGHMLAAIRDKVVKMVRPGVTTLELDRAAQEMIESGGAVPAFLDYHGYPCTICASINEEVVHGIPSDRRRLQAGDLVSIDFGLVARGFYSDTAVSVAVGEVAPEVARLIEVTRGSLEAGIAAARVGGRLGDISCAVQEYVEHAGFSVVREYTGHGIGRELHEDPRIKNYGERGTGLRLRSGMVLAIEPMVNMGDWRTEVLSDGWTVVTLDRRPSCHFEHTVALTPEGPEILTKI